jgi:hypothetical protein
MVSLGITGTRKYADQKFIDKALDYVIANYKDDKIECLVSGGAIGVDSACEIWAMKRNIPIKQFLPEYDKYGKSAPMIRNKQIVDASDLLAAFPTEPRGSSHGTENTIQHAEKKKIPIWIFPVKI